MPDTKITALTAIGANPIVPATFPIPMVDLTDTSMAASGTTKKVTVNQILGAGGTATLASATISGDLTVRTDKLAVRSTGVGIGTTTPNASYILDLTTAYDARARQWIADSSFIGSGNLANGFTIRTLSGTTDGIRFLNYAQTTEFMRIDATGLGVGTSPSATLDIRKNASGSRFLSYHTGGNGTVTAGADLNEMRCDDTTTAYNLLNINVLGTSRFLVTSTGNVGIGVTPSGKLEVQESGTGSGLGGIVSSTASSGGNAGYVFRTGGTNRWSLSITGSAGAESIRFYDINNSATRLLIDTSGNFISNVTGTAPTLATNSQMVFNLTSNTNLRISVRGSDGVTRTADLTLA